MASKKAPEEEKKPFGAGAFAIQPDAYTQLEIIQPK
jgi:hypothetical protein